MKAFEVWYEKEFPLPPTIERGPIGRDRKDGCKQAWKAALEYSKKLLQKQLEGGQNAFDTMCRELEE